MCSLSSVFAKSNIDTIKRERNKVCTYRRVLFRVIRYLVLARHTTNSNNEPSVWSVNRGRARIVVKRNGRPSNSTSEKLTMAFRSFRTYTSVYEPVCYFLRVHRRVQPTIKPIYVLYARVETYTDRIVQSFFFSFY